MIDFNNLSVDNSSVIPLYKQVSQILTEQIKNGNLLSGEKIPSELELMKAFHVSRITIRGAISEMVDDGLLQRHQGKGTFVSNQQEKYELNDILGLTAACKRTGKTITSKVLSIGKGYLTKKESKFLGVPDSEPIIEITRLRYIDDVPTLIETIHFPNEYSFLYNEDLTQSLFSILQAHNLTVHNSSRTLSIAYANGAEAKLLNIHSNTPLLLFKDYQNNQYNKPFFVSKQLYNTQNMVFYL